jgi:hypothetical protein
MEMRIRVVGVVLVLMLSLGVSAQAQTPPAATVTLKNTTINAKWKESWLTGSVKFSGNVTGPSTLRVTIRPKGGGKVANAVDLPDVQPGLFGGTITLPSRLLPKTYTVTVTGTSNGAQLTPSRRNVTLKAPPEGVVDNAFVSAVKGGKPANTLRGRRVQMFARFHFVAAPKTRKLWAYWIRPDFKKVFEAKNKPYKVNTDTFVVDTTKAGLTKGVWFCYMRSSSGTIIKRVRVRIA